MLTSHLRTLSGAAVCAGQAVRGGLIARCSRRKQLPAAAAAGNGVNGSGETESDVPEEEDTGVKLFSSLPQLQNSFFFFFFTLTAAFQHTNSHEGLLLANFRSELVVVSLWPREPTKGFE